jgi:hypothetical protein
MPTYEDNSLNFAVKWIELLLYMWDSLSLNLDVEITSLDSHFHGFPWPIQADAEIGCGHFVSLPFPYIMC